MERPLKSRLEIHLFVDSSAVVICHNPLALRGRKLNKSTSESWCLTALKITSSQQTKHVVNSTLTNEKATYLMKCMAL